jgi:hypothetical protein
MPPAAITGILTAAQTRGTYTIVAVSSFPLWPPALNPSATTGCFSFFSKLFAADHVDYFNTVAF